MEVADGRKGGSGGGDGDRERSDGGGSGGGVSSGEGDGGALEKMLAPMPGRLGANGDLTKAWLSERDSRASPHLDYGQKATIPNRRWSKSAVLPAHHQ